MKHSTTEWVGAGGARLFAQSWTPEGEAAGAVVLVHGLGEHSGRYAEVANRLADSGYAVRTWDLQGHGRSEGKRGDTSYALIYADIDAMMERARSEHTGLPVFLYAHSMGGSVALCYLLERSARLAGAVITSPGLSPAQPASPIKVFMAHLMVRIWPSLTMSNGLAKGVLSRDPEVNRAAEEDELMHSMISARLGLDILGSRAFVERNLHRLQTPLLFMQGTADLIVSSRLNLELARRLPGDVTVKSWEGLYHELHNEPEKADVLGVISRWLRDHTPGG